MEKRTDTERSFWHIVAAAIATLARRTGCSLHENPLPEIREVARELRQWRGIPPAGV